MQSACCTRARLRRSRRRALRRLHGDSVSFHRLVMSAALVGGIACAAPLAAAREPIRGAVGVDGVDVEQVVALGVGVPLNFTVFGTPGALVTLRIDGGRRVLELREVEPGVYEGSYLIDGADAVRPGSRVTATLQRNGAVAYAALDEPLLLAKGTVPWDVTAAPAETPAQTAPLTGTPVPQWAAAETTRPVPIAVTPRQPQPVAPAAFAATPPPAEYAPCSDCAVVESVRPVEMAPRGGVIGAIGGAIAGAILGKEAGEAHKQRMLTLLGAIGGGLAGRQIERRATQSTQYDVDLRLADGTLLKRRYEQPPPFAAGATIRLGTPSRTPAPGF
jgi:outer membrane lipoprotein SlyB